jgi:hypothetical protein
MFSMSPYRYKSLWSDHNTRLLRLLPHQDKNAGIECELLEYSLQNSYGTHLYEALSYVWGNPNEKLPIVVDKHHFNVTINLHAALAHLRNHAFERILWIDAICINQEDQAEKEHQIQSLTNIYGQASRVVVWLGEAADDSDLAFEEMRSPEGRKYATVSERARIESAGLALLQRPWFRRVWVC